MKRWLRWLVGGIVALAGLSMIWEPFAAEQMTPPPTVAHDVQIVRDEFGVPHIKGKTDADAAYGLAYAHAEDDFSTIQEVLAMTRGRAGAMLGSDGAQIDYVFHLLGVRATADRDYATIPAEVKASIEAYAAGLNHYASKHPDEIRLRKLFPVNGKDVVAGFVLRSPFFFGLDNAIGALVGDKLPPADAPQWLTPIGDAPDMNGSNAFAVAPKRMADGRTWLISNSHQPYEGGVAWYEAVVHSDQGLDMAGALFPGSPFVLLGHNRNLGWTNTVNHPDLIDVYRLTMNEDGTRYRFDGKWLPLEHKRVWLPVSFGPFTIAVPKTVWRSVHGPVIVNKLGAFAIRYGGIDQVKMLEQYYRITKARDWAEWSSAMNIGGVPGTNFIYADKGGRIAYIYNALFPPRKPGFDYAGILPGDTRASLWTGALPFADMPKLVDPASGFVMNANNTPYIAAGPGSEMNPKDWSPLLGVDRRLTNRAVRAIELLSADQSITPEELLAIKFDTGYSRKTYLGPWFDKLLALDLRDDPELAAAQSLLREWDWNSDGKGRADLIGEAMVRAANGANYRNAPYPDPRTELRSWVDHLKKAVGRIDAPLLEFQRLRRGTVDLPMDGGSDTLRATSVWDKTEKDGKGRVKHGDSFIMLINWDKNGAVTSQSIQPYGAATTRPQSKHYTDQMKLFTNKKFKPVHFEWSDAVAQGGKVYRP